MATAKQIAANRANAKKSTGPRTQAGREKVSQNRLTHGLLGQFRVLEGEDQQKYDQLLDQLIAEQKPVGLLETELVKKMSEHLWLSQRARRCQEGCFIVERTPEQMPGHLMEIGVLADLERFTAYQARHDHAFNKALTALLKLRKERQMQEIGFEREKRAQAAEERRERQEIRREETHKIRQTTAELEFQLKQHRIFALAASQLGAFPELKAVS